MTLSVKKRVVGCALFAAGVSIFSLFAIHFLSKSNRETAANGYYQTFYEAMGACLKERKKNMNCGFDGIEYNDAVGTKTVILVELNDCKYSRYDCKVIKRFKFKN